MRLSTPLARMRPSAALTRCIAQARPQCVGCGDRDQLPAYCTTLKLPTIAEAAALAGVNGTAVLEMDKAAWKNLGASGLQRSSAVRSCWRKGTSSGQRFMSLSTVIFQVCEAAKNAITAASTFPVERTRKSEHNRTPPSVTVPRTKMIDRHSLFSQFR